MHKKNNTLKKLLAALTMFGLIASGTIALAPAANATAETFPVNGLDFAASINVLRDKAIGESHLYEDVAAGDIDALVTVENLEGAQSRVNSQFVIRWVDASVAGGDFKYRWSTKTTGRTSGDWAYATVPRGSGLNQAIVPVQGWTQDNFYLRVEATSATDNDYRELDDLEGCSPLTVLIDQWDEMGGTHRDTLDNLDPDGNVSLEDIACFTSVRTNDRLELGDEYSDSATLNRFIQVEMQTQESLTSSRVTLKVEFQKTVGGVTSPVTFSTLRVNAYDIDAGQYIEFYNMKDFQLMEDSIVTPTQLAGPGLNVEFRANSTNASLDPLLDGAHSWGEARVQANFELVSSIKVVMSSRSGSQQLDFSTGFDWIEAGVGPLINPPEPRTSAQAVVPPNSSPTSTPQVVAIDVKPTNVTAGTRKATLIVGGFAHNSRVLTPRMKNRIDRWLERNSDLGTLTCTGFTSLPRRTSDVALSTNRGITACKFSKRQRSELETSVSQGIEDPRPGSNVRRVRLVLTP